MVLAPTIPATDPADYVHVFYRCGAYRATVEIPGRHTVPAGSFDTYDEAFATARTKAAAMLTEPPLLPPPEF